MMKKLFYALSTVLLCLATPLGFAETGGDNQFARQLLQAQPVAIVTDACVVRKGVVSGTELLSEQTSQLGEVLYKQIATEIEKNALPAQLYAPVHCGFLKGVSISGQNALFPVRASTAQYAPQQIDEHLLSTLGEKLFTSSFQRMEWSLILYRGWTKANLGLTVQQAQALKQQLGTPHVMLVQVFGNQPTAGKRLGSIAIGLLTQGGGMFAVTGQHYVVSLVDLDQNRIVWVKGEKLELDFTGTRSVDLPKILSPLF